MDIFLGSFFLDIYVFQEIGMVWESISSQVAKNTD